MSEAEKLAWEALNSITDNPAVWAILTAWVLSAVPGPFRGLVQGALGWIQALVGDLVDKRRDRYAETAVLEAARLAKTDKVEFAPADEKQSANDRARLEAIRVAENLGVPLEETSARVESAFRRAKREGLVR